MNDSNDPVGDSRQLQFYMKDHLRFTVKKPMDINVQLMVAFPNFFKQCVPKITLKLPMQRSEALIDFHYVQ